ncbi:hypothetical protein HYH02_000985 [Chlamydomonas schloesseri]|uniref:F-box domain-containing protein n=1 Tax=Chlamydomonas schloesseri TaxID=2026947 RepID=A0A836BDW9_9CHLO|nr:hypothetical protein HYH02_000985 [Chlamydomonas schloesseri]|eukprot:KAG2455169.1 hypothetical protein HYH02_000985 [Chlamydomonas schloesseri]
MPPRLAPSPGARGGAAPAADGSPMPIPPPDWADALPEPVLLEAAAGHLSLRDIAAAARVCRRWHATLQAFRRYVLLLPRPVAARPPQPDAAPAGASGAAASGSRGSNGSSGAGFAPTGVNLTSALEQFPPHLFSRDGTRCLLPLTAPRLGSDSGGGGGGSGGGGGGRAGEGGADAGGGAGGAAGAGGQAQAQQLGGAGGSGLVGDGSAGRDGYSLAAAAAAVAAAADVRPCMGVFAAALAAHRQPSLTVLAATLGDEAVAAATHGACCLAATEAAQRAAAAARRAAANGTPWAAASAAAAAAAASPDAVDPFLPYAALSASMLSFLNGLLSCPVPPPLAPPGRHLTRLALRLAAMPPPPALAPLALLPSLRRLELLGGPGAVLRRSHLGALAALGGLGSSSGAAAGGGGGSSGGGSSGGAGGGLRELVLEGVWDMTRPAGPAGAIQRQHQQQQQLQLQQQQQQGGLAAGPDIDDFEDAGGGDVHAEVAEAAVAGGGAAGAAAAAGAAQGWGGAGGGGGSGGGSEYDDLGCATDDGGFMWPALFGSLPHLEVLRLRSHAPLPGALGPGGGHQQGRRRAPLVLDLDPLTQLRELSVLGPASSSRREVAGGILFGGVAFVDPGFGAAAGSRLDVQLWRVAPLLQGLTALEVDRPLTVGEWAGVRQLDSLAAVGMRADVAGHMTTPTVLGGSAVVAYGVSGGAGGGREELSFPLPSPADYLGGLVGAGSAAAAAARGDGTGAGSAAGWLSAAAAAQPLDIFAAAPPPGALLAAIGGLAALRVRLEPLRFLSEVTSLTRLHLQWPGAPPSRTDLLLLPAAAAATGCYSPAAAGSFGAAAGAWGSGLPPPVEAGGGRHAAAGAAAAAAGAAAGAAAAEQAGAAPPPPPGGAAAAAAAAAEPPGGLPVAKWSVDDALVARRRYGGCLAALTELTDVELDCPGGELVLDAGLLASLAPTWRRLQRLVWWGAVRDTAGATAGGGCGEQSLSSALRLFPRLQELGLHCLDVRFAPNIFSAAARSAAASAGAGAGAGGSPASTNANGGRGPQPPLQLRLPEHLPPGLQVLSLTHVHVTVSGEATRGLEAAAAAAAQPPPPPGDAGGAGPSGGTSTGGGSGGGGASSAAALMLKIKQQQQRQQQAKAQQQKGSLGRLCSLTLGAGCSWHTTSGATAGTASDATASGGGSSSSANGSSYSSGSGAMAREVEGGAGGVAASAVAGAAAAAAAATAAANGFGSGGSKDVLAAPWLGRLVGMPLLTQLRLLAAQPLPLAALEAALAGGGGGGGGGSGVGAQLRSLSFAVSDDQVRAGGWTLRRLAALLPRLEHLAVALAPAAAPATAPHGAASREQQLAADESLMPLRRLAAAVVEAAAPAGAGRLPALRRLWLGGVKVPATAATAATAAAAADAVGAFDAEAFDAEAAERHTWAALEALTQLLSLSELHLAGPAAALHTAAAARLERRLVAALPHTHVSVQVY